jgi:transcriptional regulator with XRE-family HTH domain
MLGKVLFTARTKAGYTLKELSAITGTSYQHLSMMERGDREPSLPTLRRLDKALHFPSRAIVQFIRCEPEEPTP